MLSENLMQLRKKKGLTQEELALQLNVVRQTVSKWEKGLSVPDAEMLVEISERFEVPVSALLNETIKQTEDVDTIYVVSDKLAIINAQLAKNAEKKRKWIRSFSFAGIAIVVCCLIWQIAATVGGYALPYRDPATGAAVIGGADMPTSIFVSSSGVNMGSIFIIVAILAASVCGVVLTRRNRT